MSNKRRSPLRVFLFFLVGCLAIIGAVLVVEKLRGGSKLKRAKAAYIADGGSFERESRWASSVPHSENFGAIPALRGIAAQDPTGESLRAKLGKLGFQGSSQPWPRGTAGARKRGHEPFQKRDLTPFHDYFLNNGMLDVPVHTDDLARDLFEAFESKHGDTIAALNAGSTRPSSVFLPLASDRLAPGMPISEETHPHLQTAQLLTKGLMLHATLALRTGSPDVALDDIRTMQKLAIAAQADSRVLLTHLVSSALTSISMAPIWEGLTDRSWSDAQLQELQSILAGRDFAAEMRAGIEGEIIATDEIIVNFKDFLNSYAPDHDLRKYYPLYSPWLDHNRARMIELYHKGIIQASKKHYREAHSVTGSLIDNIADTSDFSPRTIVAKFVSSSAPTVVSRAARTDAELRQAIIAAALERHFLAKQAYPDELAALAPDFVDGVPLDPAVARPMRYERTPDGRYRLWSIGTDGKDDGGSRGDIIWSYPP